MNRQLIHIQMAEGAIDKIRQIQGLPEQEMAFILRWKEEGILEHFFIATSKQGAVLLFKDRTEEQIKSLIEQLPYYPYMKEVTYQSLELQF